MILHEGVSRFDGEEFVVVATGLTTPSQNIKTGPMVQLTILPKNIHPLQSNKDYQKGEAHTVCGDCPLIKRGCYVNVAFSVAQIYNGLKKNLYPKTDDFSIFKNKAVRFGAWGEPVLFPLRKFKKIINVAKNWTGYTHQWAKKFAQLYKNYLMASVSNVKDKEKANAMGWRTFRIVRFESDILPDEILCPAQAKDNFQCIHCCLCKGNSSKSKKNIAALAHGGAAKGRAIIKFLKEEEKS